MEDKESAALQIKFNDSPTAFSDFINIANRLDGCVLLQFLSTTPNMAIENFRTMMTKEGAIGLIESLAEILDYYPTKKEEEIKPNRKTAKKSTP